MSARQDRNVDEADLEALRDFYATLGPGLPLEFARVFAGDGSPAGEHWYARLQRGRGLVMTLSRKSRLSSDAITPHDLFLLPPTWELTRAVLSDLTMPQFDTTLLGLMGISSGTCVGFRIPDPIK